MARSLAEPEKLVVQRGHGVSRALVDADVGKPSSVGNAKGHASSSFVETVALFAALRPPSAVPLWRAFLHQRIKNTLGLAQPVFQPRLWS